ncbi:MAG: hypothetical protein H6Q90_6552 [Deltaproteobacteria bacterium]|nr:hypothetical protein [Deltaproteobacteria bacterium]
MILLVCMNPSPSTHQLQGDLVKSFVMACASLIASFAGEQAASAGPPAWCGGKSFDAGSYDVKESKRSEPESAVRAIAKMLCTDTADMRPHHAAIEVDRQAWGKKLGMIEADWADAVEYIDNKDGNYPKINYSVTVITQLSPMDQYKLIKESAGGLGNGIGGINDPLYAADAIGPQLTEVGRLAFLEHCVKAPIRHDSVREWAVCQGDVDEWDFAKFATQIRGDVVHDGATKMHLRVRALEVDDALKGYAIQRDRLFKADDAYKKMFEVAARGRTAWTKGIGANTKLIELVQSMESAKMSGSRKMFADCETKTAEALSTAVATIPAKAFTGMFDERMDPSGGFAYKAMPVLMANPQVHLAAIAFVLCQQSTSTGDWLADGLDDLPGVRGPRNAATGEILNEKWVFDDVNASELQPPRVRGRPYDRTGGTVNSAGGIVTSVKVNKDVATVTLKKTSIKRTQCVKTHRTNRVTRIRDDGSLDYETICDKSGTVTIDTTWDPFDVAARYAPLLKPGVGFSLISHRKIGEVIATWANAAATTPATVLGAKLK